MKLRPASPRNEILATLGRFRPALRSVALFTAVINLLMLAPSLYMLQVYDRVLGSGNEMTLLMLTLMVLGLYLLLGALEWVRSLVVIRLGGSTCNSTSVSTTLPSAPAWSAANRPPGRR